MEKKRGPGRPPKTDEQKSVRFTITLPPDVAPLAEAAKDDIGLSALVVDCLKARYPRKQQHNSPQTA